MINSEERIYKKLCDSNLVNVENIGKNYMSFSKTGCSNKEYIGYIFSGIRNDDAKNYTDIPEQYLCVLKNYNGMRLLGGNIVFFGILGDRDRYGIKDGPVPMSIEENFAQFRQSNAELWNLGVRPIGVFAANKIDYILSFLGGDGAYYINSRGDMVELCKLHDILYVGIMLCIEVFSGRLMLDNLSVSSAHSLGYHMI